MKKKRHIVMLGSDLGAQGGISAVVRALELGGLFCRQNVEYIGTHVDGGKSAKLIKAIEGWSFFLCRVVSGQVSLVHVHLSSRASFWRKLIFIIPAFVLRIPVVLHLHGSEFREFYDMECSRLGQRIISIVFSNARCIIVLSDSWQEWVLARFPKANAKVVYNPALSLPETANEPNRESCSILFLGRLGKRKGTFDLITAVSLLVNEFPKIQLLLGGDGDLKGARSKADDLGIEGNVQILGWVRGLQKESLMKRASVYVLPSYNEGLPMGLLESMASGLPVISTRVGGIPEAIDDGVDGFLISPGNVDELVDRLRTILSNRELRERMGKSAREKAETKFSLNRVVAQIENIYSDSAR